MDASQKKLKKLIQRRHPEYASKLPHWEFVEQTYEGGRDWFKNNIFKYHKEGDKEFSDRLERAYRFNHSREVVDLVDKYIFKMEITRKPDAPDYVKRFWKSATLSGQSITEFQKKVSKMTSIFGRVWIVVDTTNTGEVVSKGDEKRSGARVYCYILKPQQLCDIGYDDDNNKLWALVYEQIRDDKDPMESTGELIDRYRLWERNQYTLYTVKPKNKEQRTLSPDTIESISTKIKSDHMGQVGTLEVDAGDGAGKYTIEVTGPFPHGFDGVPLIPADNVVSDERYTSPGMIDDIAYLDRTVGNYLSNLDAIIQDQTFSQLVIPVQSQMQEDSDGPEGSLIEIGTKRIFSYNAGDGGAAPQYISPDVKQAGLILTAITKIINEIYHTAGLAGERTKEDNSKGIDNSSGVAKAYDFERVNSMLAAKADSLELIENKIIKFVAKWCGEEAPDDAERYVSYPDSFDVRGLYDEFEIAARLSLIEAPDVIRQIQMRQLAKKIFPQISEEDGAKIEKEIREWPPEPPEVLPATEPGTPAGAKQSESTSKSGQAAKNRKESFKDAKNSLANKLVKDSGK